MQRLSRCFQLHDEVRIDHFRGFAGAHGTLVHDLSRPIQFTAATACIRRTMPCGSPLRSVCVSMQGTMQWTPRQRLPWMAPGRRGPAWTSSALSTGCEPKAMLWQHTSSHAAALRAEIGTERQADLRGFHIGSRLHACYEGKEHSMFGG